MAVQFIQARVTNPGRPGRASATTSGEKMRKSRKKIKILVGRKSNPAKKRAKPRKRSLVKRASARVKSLLRRLRGSKRPKRRKSRKAVTAVARAANPRRRSLLRRRHSVSRRRHNPAFDVKGALMTGAVVIAGTYVGLKLVPYIESKLAELAPNTLTGKTLGYTMLAGAALTIAGGNYLQSRFGSKKYDLAPAAYAIAAIMAIRGLRKAELISAETPMLGYGGMHGTLDFNSDAYGSGYAAPANGMGSLPRGYSMLGSIQTADMLPSPPVGPHNVMQGYHHGAQLV